MEFFLLILLGGAIVYLWNRTTDLEVRLRNSENAIEALRSRGAAGVASAPLATVAEQLQKAAERTVEAVPESPREPAPAAIPATRRDTDEALAVASPKPDAEAPASMEPAASPKSRFANLVPKISFDFEDIFGRLLPIWAGGVTLAVAGFFLVKYSIEQGLLGPQVRVALGFLFGGALLGGAELAFRNEHRISDPRVRQALAGAGLATLYASFYLAGSLYGLVGSAVAFAGLAGVTGAAILLSFRFGMPSAILGLVGGFAAPMLVGSEEANLPLLAIYLALVTGGLTYAGNRQGRSWLALAALAGGLGWGVLMLVSGVTGFTDILAFGGYLVVMGALVPAFTDGRDAGTWLKIGAAGLAALQMAAMVAQAGYSLLAWGLYGLLAAALAFFAWREPHMRWATAFTALLGTMMLALWFDPEPTQFALVLAGLLAVFGAVPLANMYRDAHVAADSWQLGGFSLAAIWLCYGQFGGGERDRLVALASLGIALLPALGAFLLWPRQDKALPRDGIVVLSAAALGLACAGLIATPLWAAPIIIAAIACGLAALGWQRDDKALVAMAWIGALGTLMALLLTPTGEPEFQRLGGLEAEADTTRALLRWAASLAPFLALSLRRRADQWQPAADALAALAVYGVFSQFMPPASLAWIAAAGALALAFAVPARFAARLALAAVAVLWALLPVLEWSFAAVLAVAGKPMLLTGSIDWQMIALRLVPALAALASLVWRPVSVQKLHGSAALSASALLALVTAHMAFKQILSLQDMQAFLALGIVERTVWQALLLGAGIALVRLARGRVVFEHAGLGLAGLSLAHFGLFSLGWHNPLWDGQLVGPLPVANMLVPSYGVALAAIWWLARQRLPAQILPRWVFDASAMLLVSMLALSLLRHAFAGSLMTSPPVEQTEDLLRSLLGIILAIAFLLWGARTQSRSWRIGSLVLMLGAVLKVFLFDANGLEGLLRVASFVALGFSLIGIGWFYARQLRTFESPEK